MEFMRAAPLRLANHEHHYREAILRIFELDLGPRFTALPPVITGHACGKYDNDNNQSNQSAAYIWVHDEFDLLSSGDETNKQ